MDATEKPKLKRSLSVKNLFEQKRFRSIQIADLAMAKIIGDAEARGVWTISGDEKNGKTWFAMRLAKAIAFYEKVNYISAEEPLDANSFLDMAKHAGIVLGDRVLFDPKLSFDEMIIKFNKRNSSNVIFIDNLREYEYELKKMGIPKLSKAIPDKLIICLIHADTKDTKAIRDAVSYAKRKIEIKGLTASVTGRGDGGRLILDYDKNEMFWGENQEV